jgi:hypothetical protein
MINEIITLTHQTPTADVDQCLLWMKKNLEQQNKVTIIIKKPEASFDTSLSSFFTVVEKNVNLKEPQPTFNNAPLNPLIKCIRSHLT